MFHFFWSCLWCFFRHTLYVWIWQKHFSEKCMVINCCDKICYDPCCKPFLKGAPYIQSIDWFITCLDPYVVYFNLNYLSYYVFLLFYNKLFLWVIMKSLLPYFKVIVWFFHWFIHYLLRYNLCFCSTCLSNTVARKHIINHAFIMQIRKRNNN